MAWHGSCLWAKFFPAPPWEQPSFILLIREPQPLAKPCPTPGQRPCHGCGRTRLHAWASPAFHVQAELLCSASVGSGTLRGSLQECAEGCGCASAAKWQCWSKCWVQPAWLACNHFRLGEVKWAEVGPLFFTQINTDCQLLPNNRRLKGPWANDRDLGSCHHL